MRQPKRQPKLDLTSEPGDNGAEPGDKGATDPQSADAETNHRGAFLGIQFECCGAYGRIYKRADGKAYAGHCPRCVKPVTIAIRPGGTSARFFRVG